MLSVSGSGLSGQSGSSLGKEYFINDSGDVSPVLGSTTHTGSTSRIGKTNTPPPAPTMVGSSGGFQIDLVWDSSVAQAPAGFTAAITAAAASYTTLFSNKEVINIDVGYGEIDGSSLGSYALGESESYGYLTNYSTVVNALHGDNYAPSLAANDPTKAQFFLTSAEAKTLGIISGSSTAVDGFIGFTSAYPMNYSTSGTGTGPTQFDALAIAEHEISEVMGRIGMEGETINRKQTYTPLDLFNFKGPGALELSGKGGYFSVNDGTGNLGTYNNASANGGDIADWASNTAPTTSIYNAYNAFTWPGYNGAVTSNDIVEDAALGYKLTSTGVADASLSGAAAGSLVASATVSGAATGTGSRGEQSFAQLVQSMAAFGGGGAVEGLNQRSFETAGLNDFFGGAAHHQS